jgi:hypothetical protein
MTRIRRFLGYLPHELWLAAKSAWTIAGLQKKSWRFR